MHFRFPNWDTNTFISWNSLQLEPFFLRERKYKGKKITKNYVYKEQGENVSWGKHLKMWSMCIWGSPGHYHSLPHWKLGVRWGGGINWTCILHWSTPRASLKNHYSRKWAAKPRREYKTIVLSPRPLHWAFFVPQTNAMGLFTPFLRLLILRVEIRNFQ